MDQKLNLILNDYFDKSKELNDLNLNVQNVDYTNDKEQEIKKINDNISSKLYDLEFEIAEYNKRIINLEYQKQVELNNLSNKTSDIINSMIDNDKKKLIESKYDKEIKVQKDKLSIKEEEYNELKEKSKASFEEKYSDIEKKYKDKISKMYDSDEINKCKLELLDIVKSKRKELLKELEMSNIQHDGFKNIYERMLNAPDTLDETCIDFIETHINDLKICYENEKDLIEKNEYDKKIQDLKNIIDKINNKNEISDYDKKIIFKQINIIKRYSKKIEKYIDTFKVVDYIDIKQEKVEKNQQFNNENEGLNSDSISSISADENSTDNEEITSEQTFDSETDSISFILDDILKEFDKDDSIYLEEKDNKSFVKIDDKEEDVELKDIKLPSGEYISEKELDDAIDRYYEKNKGKTYYIKERKFILNRTNAYQITKDSVDKLKESLKNRSSIRLIKDDKINDSIIKKIYGKEGLKENDFSTDEYEMDSPKKQVIGLVESNKEGKYISKLQLSFYLSKIFERKGPEWIEKLKNKFSKEEKTNDNKELIKK